MEDYFQFWNISRQVFDIDFEDLVLPQSQKKMSQQLVEKISNPGTYVRLVGPKNSGKSTLARYTYTQLPATYETLIVSVPESHGDRWFDNVMLDYFRLSNPTQLSLNISDFEAENRMLALCLVDPNNTINPDSIARVESLFVDIEKISILHLSSTNTQNPGPLWSVSEMHMNLWTLADIALYVRAKCDLSGLASNSFSDDAIKTLSEQCAGDLAGLNHLANLALSIAAERKTKTINKSIMESACKDQGNSHQVIPLLSLLDLPDEAV